MWIACSLWLLAVVEPLWLIWLIIWDLRPSRDCIPETYYSFLDFCDSIPYRVNAWVAWLRIKVGLY